MDQGTREAMADEETRVAMAGQGTREAMVDPTVQGAIAEQGAWGAMVGQAVLGAMAGQPPWPWPRPSGRPLRPDLYSPPPKKIPGFLAGTGS